MNTDIKLGKIWGIPVGLHASWFIIFILVTWSLASGYFPQAYPQLNAPAHWALAALTSLLFFGSVLAHELGHSWVALRNNIPVRSITLFIFGGVAQIEREPRTPGAEFRIAIAGPLVSLGLALLFQALFFLDQAVPFLAAPSEYLARINFSLAFFNLIPGFPLDGGRVLRALVWKLTGRFEGATRVASISGQIVAFGFIGVGVFTVLGGSFFNGLWLAFIGWFLQNAAASTYAQVSLERMLGGARVEQAMSHDCLRVQPLTPLSTLIEERVLNGGQRCFFVAEDDGRLQGVLTLSDIAAVPQPRWRFTTLDQVMIPSRQVVRVEPHTGLLEALRLMDSANVAQVAVMRGDDLLGMLSREGVLHYIRTRAELRI
jgi:Zn-dependent protease